MSYMTCGGVSSRGIVANGFFFNNIVNKFKLQSRYYIYFWANALMKGMSPLLAPAMR